MQDRGGPGQRRARAIVEIEVVLVKRVVVAVLAAATVVSGVAACSSGGNGTTLGSVLGVTGPACVDANAPNSTPEQMADARLAMPITDPATGEKTTAYEQAAGAAGEFGSQTGIDLSGLDVSVEGLRMRLIENEFTAVPEGGDAGFAAAVCDMQSAWEELGYGSDDVDYVARTPHLLHASGRTICSIANTEYSAEEEFEEYDERAALADSNPAELRRGDIAELRDQLAALREDGDPTDSPLVMELIRNIETSISDLEAASDAEHAEAAKAVAAVHWAAVENQCPHLSVVGFGTVCGTVNIPENPADGIAQVHTGDVDCGTAEQVFDDYFGYNRSSDSTMNSWTCWDSFESSDAKTNYTCAENNGSDRIVLTPA